MGTLNGVVVASPLSGVVNPLLTTALNGYTQDYWQAHAADSTPPSAAVPVRGWPVHANSRVLAGALAPSYQQDYYNYVHLRPGVLALGQISSAQTRSVEVWNANLTESLTLDVVVVANATGVAVTAPNALPWTLAPNQSAVWQIGITSTGPATLAGTLTWQFSDATQNVSLTVTGNRLTAWTLPPDWANGITETLIWKTDIGESVAGDQSRVPLRGDPRRQLEGSYIVYATDRQLAESLLYGCAARQYVVPIWWDGDVLTTPLAAGSTNVALTTINRDYAVGDQVLLWGSPTVYELAEVSAISAGALGFANPTVNPWPTGTRVWPCRTMALSEAPHISRKSDWLADVPIRFEAREPCDWPAVAPTTTYLGYPVLELRPDESSGLDASFARKLVTLDNDIALPDVDDFSGLAWPTQSHALQSYGRADQGALRSLLYWLQGQAQPLWMPSWQNDATLTVAVQPTDVAITVAWCGITRYLFGLPGRKHLRIELVDGSVLYRTVTAAAENSQLTETLAIDSSLGVAVALGAVRVISWMMLATLASDTVEVHHVTDGDGLATCVLSFAGVPAEEP